LRDAQCGMSCAYNSLLLTPRGSHYVTHWNLVTATHKRFWKQIISHRFVKPPALTSEKKKILLVKQRALWRGKQRVVTSTLSMNKQTKISSANK